MRALLIFAGFLIVLALLLGCISNGESRNGPTIVPYYYDEEFSPFTGELERYVAAEPDESGYATHYYAVKGLSCPNEETPEIVSFVWDNPSTQDTYIAGSISGPVSHYEAVLDAIFNISVRVDYVCGARPAIAELDAVRKKLFLYSAEDGVLYKEELRITCPGDYMPFSASNRSPIEKGIPLGIDSGDGWVVAAYHLEVAEPYDYSTEGCAKYDEHWIHTYVRETVNGSNCIPGECRGTWYTYECPSDNSQGIRKEVYAGKDCASVSEQKDFRHPQNWYLVPESPDFPSVEMPPLGN